MAVGQLLDSYDRDEYESMAKVVDAYNKAVKCDTWCNVDGSSARLKNCSKRRGDWRRWKAEEGIGQPGVC